MLAFLLSADQKKKANKEYTIHWDFFFCVGFKEIKRLNIPKVITQNNIHLKRNDDDGGQNMN